MNIIEQYWEFLEDINGIEMLKRIERAGRTCYKSEARITEDSCFKFVRMLIRRGHESVIEHEKITVKAYTDRGVTHELVRHRIASYSQECVVGDTVVHKRKKYTIAYLYDRQINGSCYDRTHNKTIWLHSVDKDGNIVPNKIVNVFYKGKAPVYEVRTELGYTIKCTLDHRFLTVNGWKQLKELSVNNAIYVNGKPSLYKLSDEELTRLYLSEELTPQEIADLYDLNYYTVVERLKALEIFIPRLNDKDKWKYNKNHTEESYEKMRNTLLRQYREEGRKPWNYGMRGTRSHVYGIDRGDAWRRKMSEIQKRERNSAWKGGISRCIAYDLKKDIHHCELCLTTEGRLEIHHKDGNPKNNTIENLIKVCCKCHNLLHHGWHVGEGIILDKIVSIEYIGVEDVYDLEMESPNNNYIANGFVVHNSTRYISYEEGITVVKPVWLTDPNSPAYIEWKSGCECCERSYKRLIELGWKPEQARDVLPQSLKAEIVITMNLRSWRHFFKSRTPRGVHPQMRALTLSMLEGFKQAIPIVFDDITTENS